MPSALLLPELEEGEHVSQAHATSVTLQHHRLAFGFVCLWHICAAGGGNGKVVCVYMCVLQQMSFVLKSAAGS